MDKILPETDWTILMYANGNNDLEPEMRQAMLDTEKVGSNSNVNVVIQISRAEDQLSKLIRKDINAKLDDNWSGVRRYFVNRGSSDLVGNLNKVNMADPKQLYQFVKWGILSYPSKKYMLILSGHSYNCIGMMTDYSKKAPYIMGYPEMVRVINSAANEAGKKIDLLLLDTCGANSLELIYEFGQDENHAVQNVMTYIASGPIAGLPYDRIIDSLQTNSKLDDVPAVIKKIADSLSYNIVSFQIDRQKLLQIKQLFNDKTFEFLSKNGDANTIAATEQKEIVQSAYQNVMSLIIYYKKNTYCRSPLFTVAANVSGHLKLLSRYARLAFAQDNCWAGFVNNQLGSDNINSIQNDTLLPLKLSPEEVFAYISIMNPELDELQTHEVLAKLYQYKKWPLF